MCKIENKLNPCVIHIAQKLSDNLFGYFLISQKHKTRSDPQLTQYHSNEIIKPGI